MLPSFGNNLNETARVATLMLSLYVHAGFTVYDMPVFKLIMMECYLLNLPMLRLLSSKTQKRIGF